jgi:soluble lytic murein transglycosylase-like protein
MKSAVVIWIACACLFCTFKNVSGADIYRSTRSDGSVFYASQAYDSSYTLYFRDSNESQPFTDGLRTGAKKWDAASTTRQGLNLLIQQLAEKHTIDASLIHAIIETESNFNPSAQSRKGAFGLMQLMPATAARYGVRDPADPAQNIEGGIRYLKDLLLAHNGNLALALAAYNAGEGTIAKHGRRIPPYKETLLYVPAVLSRMRTATVSSPP